MSLLHGFENDKSGRVSEQVWKDSIANSGFQSYEEWLAKTGQPFLELGYADLHRGRPSTCTVLDLVQDTNLNFKISGRDFSFNHEFRSPLTLRLLDTLRDPPDAACLRVILWSAGSRVLSSELRNGCGLALRIPSQFFHILAESSQEGYTTFGNTSVNIRRSFQPSSLLKPNSTIIGRQIATVVRDYPATCASAPPVVLIVDWDRSCWEDPDFQPNLDPQAGASMEENNLFGFATMIVTSLLAEHSAKISLFHKSQTYVSILREILKGTQGMRVDVEQLLGLSLIPLMHLDTLVVESVSKELLAHWDEATNNATWLQFANDKREKLRHDIEMSDSSIRAFQRYIRSNSAEEMLRRDEYVKIEGLWADALKKARSTEAQIRDNIQLRIGDLAIEESKKSIQLSNSQIEESRKVRIFTILAFIYVPLNTVTSIFGMNIQQINHSGHSVWTFLITSVVALLLTGLAWASIAALNSVKATTHKLENIWLSEYGLTVEQEKEKLKFERNYTLLFRLYLLLWLVRKGHLSWLWKTGAFVQILTNSRSLFELPNEGYTYGGNTRLVTACDYAAYHMIYIQRFPKRFWVPFGVPQIINKPTYQDSTVELED